MIYWQTMCMILIFVLLSISERNEINNMKLYTNVALYTSIIQSLDVVIVGSVYFIPKLLQTDQAYKEQFDSNDSQFSSSFRHTSTRTPMPTSFRNNNFNNTNNSSNTSNSNSQRQVPTFPGLDLNDSEEEQQEQERSDVTSNCHSEIHAFPGLDLTLDVLQESIVILPIDTTDDDIDHGK